jgi:hypothetical protein
MVSSSWPVIALISSRGTPASLRSQDHASPDWIRAPKCWSEANPLYFRPICPVPGRV